MVQDKRVAQGGKKALSVVRKKGVHMSRKKKMSRLWFPPCAHAHRDGHKQGIPRCYLGSLKHQTLVRQLLLATAANRRGVDSKVVVEPYEVLDNLMWSARCHRCNHTTTTKCPKWSWQRLPQDTQGGHVGRVHHAALLNDGIQGAKKTQGKRETNHNTSV